MIEEIHALPSMHTLPGILSGAAICCFFLRMPRITPTDIRLLTRRRALREELPTHYMHMFHRHTSPGKTDNCHSDGDIRLSLRASFRRYTAFSTEISGLPYAAFAPLWFPPMLFSIAATFHTRFTVSPLNHPETLQAVKSITVAKEEATSPQKETLPGKQDPSLTREPEKRTIEDPTTESLSKSRTDPCKQKMEPGATNNNRPVPASEL
ncbi:hypothetical protein [Bacteroides helcogenes]|uniref:Uncharacterized protein n=1 Tax=Bacteroides helcogenes (strain ATCC 35417 / DSM 20613 / JCM 6297 / CCUG 15421 / P 36-108) TaxID=693979 RepID=E6SQW7_BACT6|nr:hypothetical protein [Bacteroides helcogenes]ADV45036.1 hypothetical protein Bache_3109 [Bacteroides helcogenes P 36-108]MDY5239894.1 hypothetical protein [Bacteroides helcogenes]